MGGDGGELVYAGCASWSLVGKKDKGQDWDGVEERNLWGLHRLKPLMGIKVSKVISGCCAATCVALGTDGSAYLWGKNNFGQLGTGTVTNVYNPMKVDIPNQETVIGGACGPNHTLLFSSKGSLFAAGSGKCGQLGTGRKVDVKSFVSVPINAVVTDVACGREFSMIVDSNGVIYSCGHPEFGCLGNGTDGKLLERANKFTFEYVTAPAPIVALAKAYGDVRIKSVSCGAKHTCAMDEEGRLYTWGNGAYGRLGHKDNKDQFEPMAVELFSNEPPPLKEGVPKFLQHQSPKIRAKEIVCGNTCTYAVAAPPYNSLYMFGQTKRTGEANMYPQVVNQVTGWIVRSVSVGNTSTAVASEKKLITWGPSPTFGELAYGEGEGIPKSSTVSKGVDVIDGCTTLQVASGQCHLLAIVDDEDSLAKEKLAALPVFAPDEVDPSVTKAREAKEASARKAKRAKAKAKRDAAKDKKAKAEKGDDAEDDGDEEAEVDSEADDDDDEVEEPKAKKAKN